MSRPFDLRDARPGDLAFVKNAWVESFKARLLPRIEREVDKLARGGRVRIAYDVADEDTLLGFAAFGDRELHYAYVRQSLRAAGIARALLEPETIEAFTFRTESGESRLRPAERGWEYRPRIVL